MSRRGRIVAGLAFLALSACEACGPRAHIPPLPATIPGVLDSSSLDAQLARALAPVLYVQRDEWFPLTRVVAVLHPTRRVIAYHLLWRDDVHGSWIPFTVPTDEEVVWVGYDSTFAPTDLWTFWHGTLLHADWRDRGPPAINVQWGKHGSLPRGIIESDLPTFKKLNMFYLFTWAGLPDIWLGDLTRRGPWWFGHGYGRYREFSDQRVLGRQLDAVVRLENPRAALTAVFGSRYSKKRAWPDAVGGRP